MYTANRTVIQHITHDRPSTAPNCGHQAGIRSTVFSIELIVANFPRSGLGSASDELVTH